MAPSAGQPPLSVSPVLIVGCGYLGTRVAELCRAAGHVVWATTRNARRTREIAALGLRPIVLDWNDRRSFSAIPGGIDRVLVAVSYDRQSGISRYQSQVGGFGQLLSTLSPGVNICYISTSGVYHQSDGRWVDETSPAHPTREGGRVHLQAEQLLHQLRPEATHTILRLAGIYGPGRVPRVADVISGRPIPSPAEGFLNLIHVDDAASAVVASWAHPCQNLYLVADDQPVARGDFYREIALQTGSPLPVFCQPPAGASVMMRSESNKRVSNRRMKRDLLPQLKFPTYRDGLRQLLHR